MSVGDSLCKTSTTDREGGQEESWDGLKRMQERRYGKRMQEIRKQVDVGLYQSRPKASNVL